VFTLSGIRISSISDPETLREALAALSGLDQRRLIDERYEKFRRMGAFFAENALAK